MFLPAMFSQNPLYVYFMLPISNNFGTPRAGSVLLNEVDDQCLAYSGGSLFPVTPITIYQYFQFSRPVSMLFLGLSMPKVLPDCL